MTAISFARRVSRRVTAYGVGAIVLFLVGFISGGIPLHDTLPDPPFVGWPTELASRGAALTDSIAQTFGERPAQIAFDNRHSITVFFWNPLIWRNDMGSELPKQSIPIVEEAATDVAKYVWDNFARDNDINDLTITFVRARRKIYPPIFTRDVRSHEVSDHFTRWQLEKQRPVRGLLSIAQF